MCMKLQILDITVTVLLFFIACYVGKLVMNVYDTWLSFNGPAIGVLAVGELCWFGIRKLLCQSLWEQKK